MNFLNLVERVMAIVVIWKELQSCKVYAPKFGVQTMYPLYNEVANQWTRKRRKSLHTGAECPKCHLRPVGHRIAPPAWDSQTEMFLQENFI